MARLVRVRGESAYEHVLDLDRNPWAEERITSGSLTVVEELNELPPDPWAKKTIKQSRGESAEKPLAKMNHDELGAVLDAEQIDTGEASTKREIVAVIEAAREIVAAEVEPAEPDEEV